MGNIQDKIDALGTMVGAAPTIVEFAFRGDVEKVKALLDSGVDINTREESTGRTGLLAAVCIPQFLFVFEITTNNTKI